MESGEGDEREEEHPLWVESVVASLGVVTSRTEPFPLFLAILSAESLGWNKSVDDPLGKDRHKSLKLDSDETEAWQLIFSKFKILFVVQARRKSVMGGRGEEEKMKGATAMAGKAG